jgi:hypothetical protein
MTDYTFPIAFGAGIFAICGLALATRLRLVVSDKKPSQMGTSVALFCVSGGMYYFLHTWWALVPALLAIIPAL